MALRLVAASLPRSHLARDQAPCASLTLSRLTFMTMKWRQHGGESAEAHALDQRGLLATDVSQQPNRDTSTRLGPNCERSVREDRSGFRASFKPDWRARMICVCVDDFGLHVGVNEAALQLAGMARIHAVACRVGGQTGSVSV